MPASSYRIPRAAYEDSGFVGDYGLFREPGGVVNPHPELTVFDDEGQKCGEVSRRVAYPEGLKGPKVYREDYDWYVQLPSFYAEGEADTEEQAVQMVARMLEMVEVMNGKR